MRFVPQKRCLLEQELLLEKLSGAEFAYLSQCDSATGKAAAFATCGYAGFTRRLAS
jgi:hypothetical protein